MCSFYKKILSAEEFTHFISGKGVKELLFETENLNEKRFKTEEYYKLWTNEKKSIYDGVSFLLSVSHSFTN